MKWIRGRWQHDENGAALVGALLAVVVLAGLAVVFVSRANSEAGASAFSVQYEAGLHAAEAAADDQLAEANVDAEYVTTVDLTGDVSDNEDLGYVHLGSGTYAFEMTEADRSSQDAEKAWALKHFENEIGFDSTGWEEGSAGQAFAIRPVDADTGDPLNLIYTVGAGQDLASAERGIRVVKYELVKTVSSPGFALLTGGDLKFGGSGTILSPDCNEDTAATAEETCIADVHVTGDYTNTGSGSTVEGQISVQNGTCPDATSAVNGCIDGADPQPVPEISARDFYDVNEIRESASVGDTENPDGWYDLCPDQTIREFAGVDSVPCTSDEVLWTSTGGNTRYRGWRWQGGAWRGDSIQSGVFYVYHSDASINGSEGDSTLDVSVLVEQNPLAPADGGALDISGNPQVQAALSDVLFIADTDIDLSGTPTGGSCGDTPETFSGLIALGEQLNVGGNVSLHGSIIVEDDEDVHGLVKRNNMSIQGNMCLRFNPNLDVEFETDYVIGYWNDLSRE